MFFVLLKAEDGEREKERGKEKEEMKGKAAWQRWWMD